MTITRPVQPKTLRDAASSTMLEELEDALYSIADAMEKLQGREAFADYFDRLDSLMDDMEAEGEDLERMAGIEYAELINEQRRDYLRGVL